MGVSYIFFFRFLVTCIYCTKENIAVLAFVFPHAQFVRSPVQNLDFLHFLAAAGLRMVLIPPIRLGAEVRRVETTPDFRLFFRDRMEAVFSSVPCIRTRASPISKESLGPPALGLVVVKEVSRFWSACCILASSSSWTSRWRFSSCLIRSNSSAALVLRLVVPLLEEPSRNSDISRPRANEFSNAPEPPPPLPKFFRFDVVMVRMDRLLSRAR